MLLIFQNVAEMDVLILFIFVNLVPIALNFPIDFLYLLEIVTHLLVQVFLMRRLHLTLRCRDHFFSFLGFLVFV